LIVWEDADHPAPSTRLRDGWRGVVLIPSDAERRQKALSVFFVQQLRYRISHSYWASHYRGEIPPFLLDLTKAPVTITPAELLVERYNDQK
jgi:hypothetical protein